MQTGSTIGELEKRAGIEDREAFWLPYADHPDGFDRGVAALRALAEERERRIDLPKEPSALELLSRRTNDTVLIACIAFVSIWCLSGLVKALEQEERRIETSERV